MIIIESLAKGDELYSMQEAFLKHDGFQCGYRTLSKITGGVATVSENHTLTDDQPTEWMS
jgi:aerobic-type carbon monoxide dehydrogenase small subunit (CoxS/CutS family)